MGFFYILMLIVKSLSLQKSAFFTSFERVFVKKF